jgi:hypothetical protein
MSDTALILNVLYVLVAFGAFLGCINDKQLTATELVGAIIYSLTWPIAVGVKIAKK